MKRLLLLFSILTSLLSAQTNIADINGDGTLNILVLGTTESIHTSSEEFSPYQVTIELQNILSADTNIIIGINVVAEDIYRTKNVSTGIANQFTSNLDYYCHSLVQYYYWPEDRIERMNNLTGDSIFDWDYVIIGSDPYIISKMPGFYSLGVNKIAKMVADGGAIPLLLMSWLKDSTFIDHFEEFTYRTADGAKVLLDNIPAGLAWNSLPNNKKDIASFHPTPNGAYLSAASIYAHIFNRSASLSHYIYDDQIADIAESAVVNATSSIHYTGCRSFISPFKSCEIIDSMLIYNHGGTSTEQGILNGLNWVVTEAQKTLQYSANPPIHFNYGRSSMGTTHLYVADSSQFDFSFGYPLQDDLSSGLVSMQYGIDQRVNENDVETDLGVALHMVNHSELPTARNVPMRTLISQMLEEIPGIKIFPNFDPWHLSPDVNKAIASYMYTMLTGDCALEGSLPPADSIEWRTLMAHKIGYRTAWNVMHMQGHNPCYDSIIIINCNTVQSWNCGTSGCYDPLTGQGLFSSLSSCQNICNPVYISDNTILETRKLVKIIDVLGRDSKQLKNQPLFYIYDDGTVEKKIILE